MSIQLWSTLHRILRRQIWQKTDVDLVWRHIHRRQPHSVACWDWDEPDGGSAPALLQSLPRRDRRRHGIRVGTDLRVRVRPEVDPRKMHRDGDGLPKLCRRASMELPCFCFSGSAAMVRLMGDDDDDTVQVLDLHRPLSERPGPSLALSFCEGSIVLL